MAFGIKLIGQSLGVILLSGLAAAPALAELSLEEINSIARQTTVLIAPGLTPELVDELEENRNNPLARENNPDGVWNPGSGVIIARENNTYYVLTVTHNFKQRDLDQNLSYGIRTSDGLVYEVKEINDGRDCPLNGSPKPVSRLFRLGCYSIKLPRRVAGPDLAIVSFESDREYPVASLGNVDNVQVSDRVYVSGWPDPEKEKDPVTGECRGKVETRTRRLAWAPVTRKIEPNQGENGYSIFYIDETRPGMSGGPVFDSNGFVIGVHGRGSADKGKLIQQYCSVEDEAVTRGNQSFESEDIVQTVSEAVKYDPPTLHTLFSSGQNSNNFLTLWNPLALDLPFKFDPPASGTIQAALVPLNVGNLERGTLEFNPREDVVGRLDFSANNPADRVEDIYEGFSLKNMIRDEPSPGCRFLLLGEPCQQ